MKHKMPKFSELFAAHDESASMAEYARVKWTEIVSELDAEGALDLDRYSRLNTIERYVRSLAEYEYLYPLYMKDGPVLKSENGNDYVNMGWAMVSKINDKLMKFEDAIFRWTKDISPERKPKLKEPSASDKYMARSAGLSIEEYRKKNGIKMH